MNLREIPFKKSVKLSILLMTSLLIAGASATVYYGLTMKPQVTVTGLTVKFVNGTDTPTGSSVNDAWCSLALKSYPNVTLTYDQAINISNTDTGSAHSIQLEHVSITPDETAFVGGNWTSINFTLIDAGGTEQTSFDYTNNGTLWNTPSTTTWYTVPANTEWTIKVETTSPAGATVNAVCTIEIAVNVQE